MYDDEEEIGADLLSDLLDDVSGDDEEIGAAVAQALKKSKVRAMRTIIANSNRGPGRYLDVPLSRAAALAAGASANLTGTPTRACVVKRLFMFSSAHDDVSVTAVTVAGRPQAIGATNAPAPITRYYRDAVDALPLSWDALPATQDLVVTVKNEHAATATNVMGVAAVQTVG